MRKFALATICAVLLAGPVQAQVPVIGPQMLMPSPLGIVLMVGQWIIQDQKRVFYIRVAGEGSTPAQARANGFRLAVEQAVGTIVLSETEVQNGRIQRDEIITHAAGFVEKFDIIKVDNINGRTQVIMDVWIAESRIANRLLNRSQNSANITGEQVATQVQTMLDERTSGDRVVATVMRDFPQRAFDVEVDDSKFNFNSNRQVSLQIPVTVKWNSTFISSLYDALKQTSQDREFCISNACQERAARQYAFVVQGGGFRMGTKELVFDDPAKLQTIHAAVINSSPTVKLTVIDDSGNVVAKSCQKLSMTSADDRYVRPPQHMININGNRMWVDLRYSLLANININFAQNVDRLRQIRRIDARIVAENQC